MTLNPGNVEKQVVFLYVLLHNRPMENPSQYYNQYLYAHKLAKRNARKRARERKPINLEVLDDIVNVYDCSSIHIGRIEVPADLIVGTKTANRAISFSSDFMPLMKDKSEFAYKWQQVCRYHLSETGITDPPVAYEYLGKFYVTEGNKRVSVLKSYGAVLITLDVTRLLPKRSEFGEVGVYYEFLDFYKLSKLYSIRFSKKGSYARFHSLLGFTEDHVWTPRERIDVIGILERIEHHLKKNRIKADKCECLLALMEIHGYDVLVQMKDRQLEKAVITEKTRLEHGHGLYRIMCLADEEDPLLYNRYGIDRSRKVDFIISCGDLEPEYLEFIVTMANKPLFYVHGNHDDRYDITPPEGCICIDDDLYIHEGIRILGLGGSYRYSNATYQYTELQMEKRIRKLRAKIRRAKGVDIVVTHAPIKGYGDLEDYAHQGFECFEKLLNDLRPKYWLFGHSHLRYDHDLQRMMEHKGTTIINCNGRYEIFY